MGFADVDEVVVVVVRVVLWEVLIRAALVLTTHIAHLETAKVCVEEDFMGTVVIFERL